MPLSNPLQEYPVLRQWAYRLVWFVGLVLGGIQIWYATTDATSPTWLAPALAVLAYVSIATNYTADKNVSTVTVPPGKHAPINADARNEQGYSPVEWLIVVLIVLVILIVIFKLLGML